MSTQYYVLGNGVIISDSIHYLGGSEPQDQKANMDPHAISYDSVFICRSLLLPSDWR